MPSSPAIKTTSADVKWQDPLGTSAQPISLVIAQPGTYISVMRRIRNMPAFSLITDWQLTDPTDPTSAKLVSSDIAGTLSIQVANIGDYSDKPFGNLTWVPLPACTFNLQTDGSPYVSLFRDAAFNYLQLTLSITAGTGTLFSQFSNVEA